MFSIETHQCVVERSLICNWWNSCC